ncbi:MAG: PIG-L family deacetylase [Anaerolineae bacterium]|nr:PIG-L family deacetylase [Anaerolineae bacterium]
MKNLVGVFAHPDDETIMLGGTLAMLAQRGVRTHIVCATRGEGGDMGVPPLVAERALLGAAREAELRCALAELGSPTLALLGYIDPDVGPENILGPFDADFDTLVSQIGTQITAHIPNPAQGVVVAHGPDGEYGHPAHKLIHHATREAVARCAPEVPFYTVAAAVNGLDDHLWNDSRTAQFVLDITPWAEAKIAAMECHRTQHNLFLRRRKLTRVRDALRKYESFYRESPSADGRPPEDGFAALLRAAGASTGPDLP